MARSVQIKQLLSDEARAEFLNFTYYLFFTNKSNLKNCRPSKWTYTSIKRQPRYELYTLFYTVFIPYLIQIHLNPMEI